MQLLKRSLLLLLVLILPIQGMAGVGMHACMSGMQHGAGWDSAAGHEAMGCHHQQGMAMEEAPAAPMDEPGEDAPSLLHDCPHCFALSHFTAPPTFDLEGQGAHAAPLPLRGVRLVSLTLDLPERPPASV